MSSRAVGVLALMLVLATGSCRNKPAIDQRVASPERTVFGQVLLPSGHGSRGVEVRVTVTAAGQRPHTTWVLFDEEGRFAHTFQESPTSVTITAGNAEVRRIDAAELPASNQGGQIDLGVIDLRDRLFQHRLVLLAAAGAPPGDVRVAMWSGLPPVGPQGEPVSLGSRQFPPVALGSEIEWLVSREVRSIYFLVERPVRTDGGREWRGGHQRLFGPFTSAELPAELIVDGTELVTGTPAADLSGRLRGK